MISAKEETIEFPLKRINEIINQSLGGNRNQDVIVAAEAEWKTIRRNNCFFGVLITVMTGIIFICFIGIFIRKYEEPDILQTSNLVIPKNKWVDDIGRTGSKKLKTLVSKVILFDSSVDENCEGEICVKNLADATFYPFFEDIKVNFFIGIDGNIFEGRGFLREGETQTIHDNEAISMKVLYDFFCVLNFYGFRYKRFVQQLTN